MRILLFFWLIVLNASMASAQLLALRNLSVADGLSQSTINHLLQDSQGYMWMATGDGLNRYDGRNFNHFHFEASSQNGLPSNMVRRLCEDKKEKRIWIGTDNGIGCYDLRTGRLSQPFASLDCFHETYTCPLFCDEQNLWCYAGKKGFIKLNIQSLEIECLVYGLISFFAVPDEGCREIIYQRSTEYIYRMNFDTGTIDSMYWSVELGRLSEVNVTKVGDQVYRMFSPEGSYRINFESGEMLPIPNEWTTDAKDVILDEIQDAVGNHYIAISGKGVFVYDDTGKLSHEFDDVVENERNEIFDLKNVRRFFIDSNGVTWCATDGDGAVLINLSSEKFRPIEWLDDANAVQRFHSFSRCIAEVDGHLWVAGHREGISIFEKGTRRARNILRDDRRCSNVSSMVDCGEYVLIGSNVGLYRLNKPYERSSLIPIIEDIAVKSIVRMQNRLCIATNGGVYKYSTETNELQLWDVVQKMYTTSLLIDKSDNVLIGLSCEGIAVVRANGAVVRVQLQTSEGVVLPNMDVLSMIQLNNHYYIATNHGLFVLREDFSQEAHLSEAEGLSNRHLYGLLADANGMIWISTNGGISRFNPVTGKFKNYTTADGLQSMEHNRNSYYSSQDGVFYMGGTTGVSRFIPNELKDNPFLPPIRLVGIEVMNMGEINVDSLANLSLPLHCAYDKNDLQFEVTVLDFFRAVQYDVEYKLEGWDRSFQSVGNDRFIRYTNLPPGTYTLIARIANEENAMETMLLTIIIEAPVWRRAWFIAGLVILFLVVLVIVNSIYIRARNRKAEAALERVREIEKMRSRISKDIHDEIGAGLTKIALMSEAAKVNMTDNSNLSATLDKLANTSRNITQGLHEIIWSVNPDADNSSSLFDHIKQYAYEFLEETDIALQVDIDDAVPLSLSPVLRRNVFLIMKEALNNAVKHASASHIQISLSTAENRSFTIELTDNGIGFSPDAHTRGHGLLNMRTRGQQCGMQIEMRSKPGSGSSLTLLGVET